MGDSAVILIIPSASYRTSAFINAVEKLDLKVLVISDKSQVFSGKYPDNLMIMNFHYWKDRLNEIFRNYRIRVAEVIRDYGKDNRKEAP